MPRRFKPKALVTDEAMQTVGIGALGVAFVSVMLIGGAFVVFGGLVALLCAALVTVLHWGEICHAAQGRQFTRHLILPIAVIILLPILVVMVANKDAILAFGKRPEGLATQPPPNPSHARMQLIRTVVAAPMNKGEFAYVNFYFRNSGTAPAIQYVHTAAVAIEPRELSPAELERIFSAMRQNLSVALVPIQGAEIEPGMQTFYSIIGSDLAKHGMIIDQRVWKAQREEKRLVYFMSIFQYRDKFLPADKWASVEICFYFFGGVEHLCSVHSREVTAS